MELEGVRKTVVNAKWLRKPKQGCNMEQEGVRKIVVNTKLLHKPKKGCNVELEGLRKIVVNTKRLRFPLCFAHGGARWYPVSTRFVWRWYPVVPVFLVFCA